MSLTVIPLVSKLSKNVIRILGCNPSPMTLQGTNTYLVGTGKRRVLVDAGDEHTAPAYIKLLADVLKNENATVEHLIVTHWHHDHIGGTDSIKNLVETKLDSKLSIWKYPEPSNDERRGKREKWRELKDEQLLRTEGAELRVKYTPGHTTDHVCLLLEDDDILFSGDCILGEGTAVFEDLKEYMESLMKILAMRPKIIYPGHGPIIEDPADRIKFYIDHRTKRENEILRVLKEHGRDKGLSDVDLVSYIYKDTPKNLWQAAAINVSHHLEKLLKEGKVKSTNGHWLLNSNER